MPFDTENGVRGTTIRAALFDLGEREDPGGMDYLTSAATRAVLPEPMIDRRYCFCQVCARAGVRRTASGYPLATRRWGNWLGAGWRMSVDASLDGQGQLRSALNLINRDLLGKLVNKTLRIVQRKIEIVPVVQAELAPGRFTLPGHGGHTALARTLQTHDRGVGQCQIQRGSDAAWQIAGFVKPPGARSHIADALRVSL